MASIPLVALDAQQPPSVLDQYGKAAQLAQMVQQQKLLPGQLQEQQQNIQAGQTANQMGAVDLQLKQQQLKDQQAIAGILYGNPAASQGQSATGTGTGAQPSAAAPTLGGQPGAQPQQKVTVPEPDPDRFAAKLQQIQDSPDISGPGKLAFTNQITEMQQKRATLDATTLANEEKVMSRVGSGLASVANAPPEDQAAQYTLERNSLARDPATAQMASQIPAQYPGPDQLRATLQRFTSTKDMIEWTKQQNEAPGQVATSQKAAQEAAMTPAERAAISSPELQAQNAWLAKNPDKDASDYSIMMKKLIPAYNFNLQGGAGGGLNQSALDQAAQRYAQTGVLPAMGMGSAGAAARKAIMNRAGELQPAGSIAANSAAYDANKNSLENLQKNFDQVTAFENTAGKNLDQFLSTAKNVVDSGSPLANMPLRLAANKVAGSPNQAAFDAARTTALTEISKVLNSSNASGVLSDSARNEVSQLVGKDATLKQIYSAANILKQDMANRHDAYQDQIGDIQSRLGMSATSNQLQKSNKATDPFAAFGGAAHSSQ